MNPLDDVPLVEENNFGGKLGVGFKDFVLSYLFGETIQFDEHIFSDGWFNNQLEKMVKLDLKTFFFRFFPSKRL